MWTFRQSDGAMYFDNVFMCYGFAGHGEGKNNPILQAAHDVGPLPVGRYAIAEMIPETASHGPYVLRLVPDPSNIMYDRGGFLIHGDNKKHPGTGSTGCIILPRTMREIIWASCDRVLEVVSGLAAERMTA